MATIKAKPVKPSTAQRVDDLEQQVAQLQALAQQLVDSQVQLLGTFEQIVQAARKHAETKQP
jgi:hypothetical protein